MTHTVCCYITHLSYNVFANIENHKDVKYTLKRRLSSGKRWKIICEHYSFLLCKCGRTSVKTCSLKSMALQMPSYSKYACNIVKIGGRLFTPRVRVVPYTSFCASVCNFTKTWPNFLSFWWFQNLAIHTNSYMLDDQPFLVGSTPFLSQCKSHDQNSTSSLIHTS